MCTDVLARVWPPTGLIPAEAWIGSIRGQTPAETLVYDTFPPKLTFFTSPGAFVVAVPEVFFVLFIPARTRARGK